MRRNVVATGRKHAKMRHRLSRTASLAELGHSMWNPNNLGKRSKPNSAALVHLTVWRWTMQTLCRILPNLTVSVR